MITRYFPMFPQFSGPFSSGFSKPLPINRGLSGTSLARGQGGDPSTGEDHPGRRDLDGGRAIPWRIPWGDTMVDTMDDIAIF